MEVAARDHLRVWIEADMVKRWEEGPASFRAAVTRVAALSRRPGVVGIKVADELGYHDGLDSAAKVRRFLSDTARALHAAAPHKLILVDMVVPQLGCLPGPQQAVPAAAACAAAADAHYPELALPAIDSYLRLHAIDVLDLSTGLLADSTYASWGTTSDAAQTAAWQEVSMLAGPAWYNCRPARRSRIRGVTAPPRLRQPPMYGCSLTSRSPMAHARLTYGRGTRSTTARCTS